MPLGITGSLLLLPSVLLGAMCAVASLDPELAAAAEAAGEAADAAQLATVYGLGAVLALAACVLGFVAGVKSRVDAKQGANMFLAGALALLVELWTNSFIDLFAAAALILYVAAAIISYRYAKQNPVE